jgi:hypothetical protein
MWQMQHPMKLQSCYTQHNTNIILRGFQKNIHPCMRESQQIGQNEYKAQNMIYSNLQKHLFLDISFTYVDTLVPSIYQCVETRSREVF